MIFSGEADSRKIETAIFRLPNNWSGVAVISAHLGKAVSEIDWLSFLSSLCQHESLFEDVEKILKKEKQNCVFVKKLEIGNNSLKVVIKSHRLGGGFRQFFRALRPGRAVRNLRTAIKLCHYGIDVAAPLAAMHQRRNLLTKQSIYITEYLTDSCHLYAFLSERLGKTPAVELKIKRELSHQIANILAMLHKNGLWHRDSKASNFIVSKDACGKYKISLIDLDGVKPYLLRRRRCQLRTLWQLAASTLPISAVNRTDYWRTFVIYCDLIGLEISRRRRIFRKLTRCAKAKYLRSMQKAADGG